MYSGTVNSVYAKFVKKANNVFSSKNKRIVEWYGSAFNVYQRSSTFVIYTEALFSLQSLAACCIMLLEGKVELCGL